MIRWFALVLLLLRVGFWSGTAEAQRSKATPSSPSKKATSHVEAERGKVLPKPVQFGGYFQYLPKREAVGVLVVVDGQPTENTVQEFMGIAQKFAERWVEFAEEHGLILIAPAFDEENFESVSGNQGGLSRSLRSPDHGG